MILLSAVLFFGLLLGLDVGFSMILAALAGLLLRHDGGGDVVMAPLTLVSNVDTAVLITVPLFVLAGS